MACISGRKGWWGTPFSRSSLRIRDWNPSSKRGGVQAAGMKRASSCGDIFACTKPAGKTEPITASTRAGNRTEPKAQVSKTAKRVNPLLEKDLKVIKPVFGDLQGLRDFKTKAAETNNLYILLWKKSTEFNNLEEHFKALQIECSQLKNKLKSDHRLLEDKIRNQAVEYEQKLRMTEYEAREDLIKWSHGADNSPDDRNCDTDDFDSKTITKMNKLTMEFKQVTEAALMMYYNKLTQEVRYQGKKATKEFKSKLDHLRGQMEKLCNDKRILEEQMIVSD